jgi:hypothetical protein
MRWTHPRAKQYGDTRVARKFLWLPLRIGYETRWLEMADVVYIYRFQTRKDADDKYLVGVWEPYDWGDK